MLPGDHRKIAWVRSLAELEPDLVITTGDNLAHLDSVPAVTRALGPLLEIPGAFVTGSNDFYLPVPKNPFKYFRQRESVARPSPKPQLPSGELINSLTSGGWHYLDNLRTRLTVRGTQVSLVGTGDAHIENNHFPPPANDAGREGVRIGITHAPYQRVLARMRMDGADLTLAGHTHGGQVCIPGYGALVTNCDLDRRMAKGLHRWPSDLGSPETSKNMWLHVSAGLGTSPFTPIRFACRPEASLLTLTSK